MTVDVTAHVAARIRDAREKLAIRQGDLARRLGMTPAGLSKIELGQSDITAPRLYQIARLLKVPVSEFFAGLPGATKGV